VNLTQGWNQIGNPYNFNIAWSDVLAANPNLQTENTKLRTFEQGSYSQSTPVLKKGEGGFVLVGSAAPLIFPVTKNSSVNNGRIASEEKHNEHNPIDADQWEVQFNLNQNNRTNSYSGIGMQPDALDNFDKYDDITPPRFIDYLELNHSKAFMANPFAKDIVPTADSHTWSFEVESSDHQELASLKWDNSSFGYNEKELFLIDENEGVSINMRTLNSYLFKAPRRFKIIFGGAGYLELEVPNGIGKILSVSPNPSRGEMKIVVSLPGWKKDYRVNIELINLLGQKSADVYSGILDSGSHELLWNGLTPSGDRSPSGIYFLRFLYSDRRSVYRIVLD